MTRKNRYVSHSHLSAHHFRQLLRLFALDLEATTVADLTGLNRNTVNRYFLALRQRIARACEQETPLRGGRILLRPSARQGEAGPRRRQQNDCLWHLQTEWESLYGDRPRRDNAHPASHSAGEGGPPQRHPLGPLAGLRWVGGHGLSQAPTRPPWGPCVCPRAWHPYQRHRELLGRGQDSIGQTARDSPPSVPSAPERV